MGAFIFAICFGVALFIIWSVVSSVKSKERRELIKSVFEKDTNLIDYYIQHDGYSGVAINEDNEEIIFVSGEEKVIIPFQKIIDCEIMKDNISVFKSSKSGAIVGGIIAGGVGAIVGGSSGTTQNKIKSLDLKILFDDLRTPVKKINFFWTDQDEGSSNFQNELANMEKWHGMFTAIISRNNKV